MSKMVTLKTEKINRFNKSVILGGVEVKFDSFGLTDVMERHAEKLIEVGLIPVDEEDKEMYKSLLVGKITPTADIDVKLENTKLKARIEELEAKMVELMSLEKEEIQSEESEIDSMTKEQMISLCKEIKLPSKEWGSLKIDDLKSYIKSKL